MFEFGIICVILLAVGYWATLVIMGRHDDVLHGQFVHPELAVDGEMPSADAPPPSADAPPPFPKRPVHPAPQVNNAPAPVSSEALQSLLAEIKQDLKDVA